MARATLPGGQAFHQVLQGTRARRLLRLPELIEPEEAEEAKVCHILSCTNVYMSARPETALQEHAGASTGD
jgi:hypothetical protein